MEEEELARGRGVSGRGNSTYRGLGAGESAKNSVQQDWSKSKEGERSKKKKKKSQPFPKLPTSEGKAERDSISATFIHLLVIQQLLLICSLPGLRRGRQTREHMG